MLNPKEASDLFYSFQYICKKNPGETTKKNYASLKVTALANPFTFIAKQRNLVLQLFEHGNIVVRELCLTIILTSAPEESGSVDSMSVLPVVEWELEHDWTSSVLMFNEASLSPNSGWNSGIRVGLATRVECPRNSLHSVPWSLNFDAPSVAKLCHESCGDEIEVTWLWSPRSLFNDAFEEIVTASCTIVVDSGASMCSLSCNSVWVIIGATHDDCPVMLVAVQPTFGAWRIPVIYDALLLCAVDVPEMQSGCCSAAPQMFGGCCVTVSETFGVCCIVVAEILSDWCIAFSEMCDTSCAIAPDMFGGSCSTSRNSGLNATQLVAAASKVYFRNP